MGCHTDDAGRDLRNRIRSLQTGKMSIFLIERLGSMGAKSRVTYLSDR